MSMILLKAFTTGDFCGSGTINPIKSLNLFPSNANILSLGARFMTEDEIYNVIDMWLKEPFGGDRHQRRIDKLDK